MLYQMPQSDTDYLVNNLIAPVRVTGREVWIQLPSTLLHAGMERSGIALHDIVRDARRGFPMAHIDPFPGLCEAIEKGRCVYSTRPEDLARNYYLEVMVDGRLIWKYQLILGSREFGALSPTQVEVLLDRFAAQVAAAPHYAGLGKPARSLAEELAMLRVADRRLILPSVLLGHYAEIKGLAEKAGGVYKRLRGQAYFLFEEGVDVQAVHAQLLAGEKVNFKRDFQFFASSPDLACQLCDECGPLAGLNVLEPSAGDGVVADEARRRGARVKTVELWSVNAQKLRAKGYDVIERDFLSLTPDDLGTFDAIVANPPFSRNQDIEHVEHMLNFLNPGGVLSSVMSASWQTGSQKKHREFRSRLRASVHASNSYRRALSSPPGRS